MVAAFVLATRAVDTDLTIVDVPGGRRSFDIRDHADEAREAVTTAVDRVPAVNRRAWSTPRRRTGTP